MTTELSLRQIYDAFLAGIYPYQLSQNFQTDSFVSAQGGLSAEDRLAIYRGSVVGNLCSALGDIYPAVKACVGDEFFEAMSARFIRENPSRSAGLDDYGASFPVFLSSFEPLKDLPYLNDLASLEWHWHRAFHAPSENTLSLQQFAEMNEREQTELVLVKTASLQTVNSDFPIFDIWRACLHEDESEVSLDAGGGVYAVWRIGNDQEGYQMQVDALTEIEAELLADIDEVKTFGDSCHHLVSRFGYDETIHCMTAGIAKGWLVWT